MRSGLLIDKLGKLWFSNNLELGLRNNMGMGSRSAIEVLDRNYTIINSYAV